jgi:hypothetical protein
MTALVAAQPEEAEGKDAALEKGIELVLDEPGGSSGPLLVSVWAMKLPACCRTRQERALLSGRWRW